MNARRLVVFFVAGALIGTLGDCAHSHGGVLSYPHPWLFGEPWWIIPLMGMGGVLLGGGAHFIRTRCGGDDPPVSPRDMVLATVWLACAYAASVVFQREPVALAIALTATFVARVLRSPSSRVRWIQGCAAMVAGPLVEATLSSTGAFIYANPDLWRVPSWLPALYMHVAFATAVIERHLASQEAR